MIYFAQADVVNHIKIGFTDGDVDARIAQLQTGSPVPIKLLGVILGTIEDEKDLHRRFASARVCGEWFKPVPELLAIIPSLGMKCEEAEVVVRQVQIKILTVGRKQFTGSLLEQLPSGSLFVWPGLWTHIRAGLDRHVDPEAIAYGISLQLGSGISFWGWIKPKREPGSRVLVFEQDGRLKKELFKSGGWVGTGVPLQAIPHEPPTTVPDVWIRILKTIWKRDIQAFFSPEQQLFIGV